MIAPGGHRSGSAVRIAATVQALSQDYAVTVALVTGNDGLEPGVVGRCTSWCADRGVGLEVVSAPSTPRNPTVRAVRLWLRSVSARRTGSRRKMPSQLLALVGTADLLWVFHVYPYMAGAVPGHRCTVVDVDDFKEQLDPKGPGLLAVGRRLHRNAVGRLRRRVLGAVPVVAVSSADELVHLATVASSAQMAVLVNTAVDPRAEDGGGPRAPVNSDVKRDPRVVMVGNLAYRPNAEAAAWFIGEVWTRVRSAVPSATFAVIGAGADVGLLAGSDGDGVELMGEVPDLAAELTRASVSVAPVLAGTGTRVKIVEALAWGLPVVSTSVGAGGLDVVPGRDLLVADDAAAFAAAVVSLLGDREAAAGVGSSGRAVYEANHHPTVFAQQVRSLSDRAVAAGARLDITHVVLTHRFAGIERHVTSSAAAMVADGHRVRIVCLRHEVMAAGFASGHADAGVELVAAANWRRAAWSVARIRHTDVVHAHTTGSLVAAALGLVGRSTPLVVTRHFASQRWSGSDGQGHRIARLRNPPPDGLATGPVRAAAQRWVDGRVRQQVAVSHTVAITPAVAGGIGEGAEVIHSGVMAPTHRARAAQRSNTVLVLQRLETVKATDVALLAWAASGLRDNNWVLDVVGGGSLLDDLADMAQRLGISDSVEFHGHVDNVTPFVQRAALLLAPAPDEPFGLSVVEAMAAGLPVVAAAGGGHLETLGSVDGAALFQPGDTAGAATQLDRLGPDVSARQELADAQFTVQQESFDLRRQATAMEMLYRGVVGVRGRDGGR